MRALIAVALKQQLHFLCSVQDVNVSPQESSLRKKVKKSLCLNRFEHQIIDEQKIKLRTYNTLSLLMILKTQQMRVYQPKQQLQQSELVKQRLILGCQR